MRVAIFLILTLFLSSCFSYRVHKHKNRICSDICPEKVIIRVDSVRVVETEIIKLPPIRDTLFIEVPYNLFDTIYIEDKTWRGRFYLTESKLTADIQHLSDSIEKLSKVETVIKTETKTETIVEKVKNPLNRWLFWVVLALLGVIVWLKRKVLLKWLKMIFA